MRLRQLAFGVAAWLLSAAACAADLTPELRTELQRIAAERKRLEAVFADEEARCQSRFAVTACLDDVRQRRRAALDLTRSRELAIDDTERRQRATARREAVEEKQRRAAARPVAEPAASAVPAAALPAPAPASAPAAREPQAPPSTELARQRAAAAHERQQKLCATQQRVEARQAARARQQRPAAPLTVPPAASR